MSAQRYPLCWPEGRARTPAVKRQRALFKVTFGSALDDLDAELHRLGAKDVLLSTNVELRLDGWPRHGAAAPTDPGAALYFKLKGRDTAIACDRWGAVKDNVRAIGLTIAAIRAIERHGGTELMEAAFRGYAALPPGANDWRSVFGVGPSATIAEVKAARNRLLEQAHPDRGGTAAEAAKVNEAWTHALKHFAGGAS